MYYTLFQVYRELILLDFNSSVQSLPFQLIYTHRKFGCTSFKYITRTEKNNNNKKIKKKTADEKYIRNTFTYILLL